MKTTTIRELKHDMTTVLSWMAAGETVEVRRRDVPVAVLSSPRRKSRLVRQDFLARLRKIYGRKVLPAPATLRVGGKRDG